MNDNQNRITQLRRETTLPRGEMRTLLTTMSEEDAALQMELLGHSFFVFVNQDTDRVNVLYQRKDGNLGLLEPEA